MEKFEKELLREALLRRLAGPPGASVAPSPPTPSMLDSHIASYLGISPRGGPRMGLPPFDYRGAPHDQQSDAAAAAAAADAYGARLTKRRKYSNEDGPKKSSPESKEGEKGEEEEAKRRARSASEDLHSAMASSSREATPRASSADFYKEIYSSLGVPPPSLHQAPPPGRDPRDPIAAQAARDLAYLDSLTQGLPRHHGAPPSSRDAFLDSLARGGGHHAAHHHLPPPPAHLSAAHYPPSSSAGLHGHPAYSSLLSQLAAGHTAASAAATPPPPVSHAARAPSPGSAQSLLDMMHAASRKSQIGLSYHDIMDVWKEMNQGNNAPSGDRGAGEGKKEEE